MNEPYNIEHTKEIHARLKKLFEEELKSKGYTFPELIIGFWTAIYEQAYLKSVGYDN